MSNQYFEHEYSNGLHLLVEPMPGVQSAAFTFLAPAGAAQDSSDALGAANLLSTLVTRGAGELDNRALTIAMDNLGVQRNESAEIVHTSFTAAALSKNLLPALAITADIIRRPMLDPEQLEACKAATLQEIKAIEDEPSQKVFIELKRRSLPDPLGRPILGDQASVERMSIDSIKEFHRRCYRPNGAILGVAGAVKFEEVREQVGQLFADWQQVEPAPLTFQPQSPSRGHIVADKVQTQIGLSFAGVPYSDADFFNAHGAIGVLSGGMSSRLWTEIREKHGLCYSVGASYHPLKDRGLIVCHASSTNERAAETLERLLAELERLSQGIQVDEVRRVQAGLKSSLVMQEESTSARASVLARSWYNLGRVRSLQEVANEIDRLSPEGILGYLERHPPRDFTILTLGPMPLETTA